MKTRYLMLDTHCTHFPSHSCGDYSWCNGFCLKIIQQTGCTVFDVLLFLGLFSNKHRVTTMSTYHRIYQRVEYPMERGYRMEPVQLPTWMHIEIDTVDGSKHLTVHSRIHVNREVQVHPCYSTDFTDAEIIKDLSGKIYNMFIK